MEVLRFGIKQLLQFSQDIFVHLYSLVVVMTVNFHLICADTLPAEKGGHMKPAAPDGISRQQVESTGFSAIFEKLMITAGAQLYAYKTIRANNGRESENTVNHKYLTSSVESAPARSARNRNICP